MNLFQLDAISGNLSRSGLQVDKETVNPDKNPGSDVTLSVQATRLTDMIRSVQSR